MRRHHLLRLAPGFLANAPARYPDAHCQFKGRQQRACELIPGRLGAKLALCPASSLDARAVWVAERRAGRVRGDGGRTVRFALKRARKPGRHEVARLQLHNRAGVVGGPAGAGRLSERAIHTKHASSPLGQLRGPVCHRGGGPQGGVHAAGVTPACTWQRSSAQCTAHPLTSHCPCHPVQLAAGAVYGNGAGDEAGAGSRVGTWGVSAP